MYKKNKSILNSITLSLALFGTIGAVSAVTPSITSISEDRGMSQSDMITRDSAILYMGYGDANSSIELIIDGNSIKNSTVDSMGNFTIDGSTYNLTEGSHNVRVVTNNNGTITESNSSYITIDKSIYSGNIDTPISGNGIIEQHEKSNFVVSGNSAEAGTRVSISISDGINVIKTSENSFIEKVDGVNKTVKYGDILVDNEGNWNSEGIDISNLNEGTIDIIVKFVDRAGNITEISENAVIAYSSIQTPAITGISEDSGKSSDDLITNDNNIKINGTSNLNRGEIEIYVNGNLAGTTTSDYYGYWEFEYLTNMPDGEYEFTAIARYETLSSEESNPVNVVIDTTIDEYSKILMPFNGTKFELPSEFSNISLIGSSSENNATINIKAYTYGSSEVLEFETESDNEGQWRIDGVDITYLSDGIVKFEIETIDIAGNMNHDILSRFIIKGTNYSAPTEITGFSDDSGSIGDNVTNDQTLIIRGTSDYSNSVVEIYLDEVNIGSAFSDSNGDWEFDYTGTSLNDGEYIFRAEVIFNGESAGTSLPKVINIFTGDNNTTINLSGSDNGITSESNPVIYGECSTGNLIKIVKISDNSVLGETSCNNNGEYMVQLSSNLSYGLSDIKAEEIDNAGNINSSNRLGILLMNMNKYADIQRIVSNDISFGGNCNNSGLVIRNYGFDENNNFSSEIIDYVTDETIMKNFVDGYFNPGIAYGDEASGEIINNINLYIDGNKVSEGYCVNNEVKIDFSGIVNGIHEAYVTQTNAQGEESSIINKVYFRADKGLILPDPKIYNEDTESLYYEGFEPNVLEENGVYKIFSDTDNINIAENNFDGISKDTSPSYEIMCNYDGSEVRFFVDGIATDELYTCQIPNTYEGELYPMIITAPYLANGTHSISYTETTPDGLTAQSATIDIDIQGTRFDVNDDGVINTIDLAMISRKIAQLTMSGTGWIDSHFNGDVNCDTVTNSIDLALMSRYISQLDMTGTGWCR